MRAHRKGSQRSAGVRVRPSRWAVEWLEDRLLLSSMLWSDDTTASESASTAPFVPGEILVGFEGMVEGAYRSHGAAAALDAAGKQVGAFGLSSPEILAHTPASASHAERLATRWLLPWNGDVRNTLRMLAGQPGIAYAEPNYIVQADVIPNDTQFSNLWGMNNTGQTVNGTTGTPEADIDAPEAWDIAKGSTSIVVGVIDTGVDYTHPDLAANIWTNPSEIPNNKIDDDNNGCVDDVHGCDFVNNDGDPFDDHGHGTHVSGTIGAVGNNAAGVVGVNWTVQIIGIKFLDSGGSGSTANAVAAVNYATTVHNAGVPIVLTSNSWGGGGFSQALKDAIDASGAAGMLFVAAAGNGSSDNDASPHYPSSYTSDNIIAVAATDQNDAKASFSNWGATSVDLGAPGVNVLSTVPTAGSLGDPSGYRYLNGTSMATPHVSGVAALAWSLVGAATPYQPIRDAIFGGVDPKASMAGITVTGGRLNALGTLMKVGMVVAGSSPAAGEVVSPTKPTSFVVDFSFPADPATVDAGDLTVYSVGSSPVSADSVALSADRKSATFSYLASPVTAEGLQTMHIDAGAIKAVQSGGVPTDPLLKAWTAPFRYDSNRLQVTTTNPPTTDPPTTVTLPLTSFQVNFNEPFDPATVGTSDLVLSQGSIVGAAADATNTSVTYTLTGVVSEGTLTVMMPVGAVSDTEGNPMLAYTGSFDLDFGTTAFPTPLLPLAPLGSLIYDPTASGFLSFGGDTDSFTIDLDAGQTITAVVDPGAGLQPTVEAFALGGASLGSAASAGFGKDAVLQTVSAGAAGTYKITVGGTRAATGPYNYTLQIILNAAIETENQDGAANDTIATAQNIDASFTSLAPGATRGAVLAQTEDTGCTDPDGFGYVACSVAPTFTDISAMGTKVLVGEDDAYVTVSKSKLNGFQFNLYGTTYTSVIISSNGLITFAVDRGGFGTVRNGSPSNSDLTSFPAVAAIAPFWDDLEITGTGASVVWQVIGSSTQPQKLIIQWNHIRFWPGGSFPNDITFQAVLEEAGNTIQFNYQKLDNGQGGSLGKSATVGIKDKGTQGANRLLLVLNNGPNKYVGNTLSTKIAVGLAPATSPDFYAVDLVAGQRATVALTTLSGGNVDLALLNSAGSVLASGNPVATNVDEVIDNFVAATTGTYYARVTGVPRTKYTVVAMRGLALDVENNNDFASAQELDTRGVALGGITTWITRGLGVIEGFEDGNIVEYTNVGEAANASVAPAAAHDDTYGLEDQTNGGLGGWSYRNDAAVQVKRGDTISTWIRSSGTPTGRGYFGFGATASGTLSLVMAPNTGQFLVQRNANYGYQNLAAVSQSWLADHWYRMEVVWKDDGSILARLYDSDGTTLLNTVTASDNTIASGGIAFRSFDSTKHFDSVQLGLPNPDYYKITLSVGQTLDLATATPGGGTGQFVNDFDPRLRLFDASGVLVASNDNAALDGRNAQLSYTAPPSGAGTYYIEVNGTDLVPRPAPGEYLLTAHVTSDPPVPYIRLNRTTGLVTTESGGTDSFAVSLNTQPTADVTITLSSNNTAEGTVSPTSVTFTPGNWYIPQTVTVTGVNDLVDDGDIQYTIVTDAAVSADVAYNGMNADDASVKNLDDDTAGITVSPVSGLTTTESGGTATFTVVLNSQPLADVSIALSSSDTTEGTVSPVSMTFTSANWNVPQSATVTGVDDVLVDFAIGYSIVTAPSTSTDPLYSGIDPSDVSVTNLNNDGTNKVFTDNFDAGASPSWGNEVGNWLASGGVYNAQAPSNNPLTYSSLPFRLRDLTFDVDINKVQDGGIWLRSQDNRNGILLVTGGSGGTGTGLYWHIVQNGNTGPSLNPVNGLFNSGTSNIHVRVTATADTYAAYVNGSATPATTLTTTAFYSGRVALYDFSNQTFDNVRVEGVLAPGITVKPTSGLVTYEDQTKPAATFTVVLDAPPAAGTTVAVPLSSSNPAEGTVSPASLTFTPSNWDTPQTVSVKGADDSVLDLDVAYTIRTDPATSADPNYDGMNAADVSATNIDNEAVYTTYSSTDVPKNIADLSTITSTLTVSDSYPLHGILDLDVQINITHTWDGDLKAFLIGPDGTRVELFTHVGGSGDNFTNTIFDDEATTRITAGAPPFTGRFRPVGLLSNFDAKDVKGTWTLEISDDAKQNRGKLNGWQIMARHAAVSPLMAGPRAKPDAPGADASHAHDLMGGHLRTGTITVAVDDPTGALTLDQLLRIRDALATLNASLAPLGVLLTPATGPGTTVADIHMQQAATSPCGGLEQGVLGCAFASRDLTIIGGWNWFAGSDPRAIGSDQYDYQTVVTHELAHLLGLGHSDDPSSLMYAMLGAGSVRRTVTASESAGESVLSDPPVEDAANGPTGEKVAVATDVVLQTPDAGTPFVVGSPLTSSTTGAESPPLQVGDTERPRRSASDSGERDFDDRRQQHRRHDQAMPNATGAHRTAAYLHVAVIDQLLTDLHGALREEALLDGLGLATRSR